MDVETGHRLHGPKVTLSCSILAVGLKLHGSRDGNVAYLLDLATTAARAWRNLGEDEMDHVLQHLRL